MRKIIKFSYAALGLITSKIWHDTLRDFIRYYIPTCSRELLRNYVSINAAGVLIGGITAGLITDSLTPKRVFPFAMIAIGLLSAILIGLCEFPDICHAIDTLLNIDLKQIIIFFRGIGIAMGMNCAYVAVGNLYKNDPFLAKATNYLYLILFSSLALAPLLISKVPAKPTFIIFTLAMFVIAILLYFNIPKTEGKEVNIIAYFKTWLTLVRYPEFLASCAVCMICTGGFYNIVYIFTDAHLHQDYFGELSWLQYLGRQCTAGVLIFVYLLNIKALQTSEKNCAQYMAAGMAVVTAALLVLLYIFIQTPITIGLIAEVMFYLTCICSGFCQSAGKSAVIAMSQKIGTNITGSAQSFVTLLNSLLEQQGAQLILTLAYPLGVQTYLGLASGFTALLSWFLFKKRKKINGYLESK